MYEQVAEVLRAELTRVSYERNQAEAEIERLRQQIFDDNQLIVDTPLVRMRDAEIRNLQSEIERLRAVLEEIAEGTAATWISARVREALGERNET